MSVLLTEGSNSCHVIGFGCLILKVFGSSVVIVLLVAALLCAIDAFASAISLLSHCSSLVIGSDVLLFGGFGCW